MVGHAYTAVKNRLGEGVFNFRISVCMDIFTVGTTFQLTFGTV